VYTVPSVFFPKIPEGFRDESVIPSGVGKETGLAPYCSQCILWD
jgi:hypothetical protein